MSKVSRADWSASTPWGGITDKPASFGASDIGQLTALGYGDGNVPVYHAATGRFRPGSRFPTPAPAPPTPTPSPGIELWFNWDVPSLYALQSYYEDFTFNGALPSMPVAVGAPFDDEFVGISASIVDVNTARVTVQNLGLADLDLGEGQYRLHLFNGL